MSRWMASLACMVLLASGCRGVGTYAHEVVPFRSVGSIEEFVGDYENVGQPHSQYSPVYFSDLIWIAVPASERYRIRESIRTIQVRSTGPKTLLVRGLDANGTEVKASSFELDKDFRVRDGVIHIDSRSQGTGAALYPMGPMAGATITTLSLGLDRDGNAQRVREETNVGLSIIGPIANTQAQGKRFRRIRP